MQVFRANGTSLAAYSTKKIAQQIRDIEHKQTTCLITTLYNRGVRTLVIGDVRDLRQQTDIGHTNNQKIHQWSHGSVRFKLTGHQPNALAWRFTCKRKPIRPARARSACTCAVRSLGACSAVRISDVGSSITATGWERLTFGESIWVKQTQ